MFTDIRAETERAIATPPKLRKSSGASCICSLIVYFVVGRPGRHITTFDNLTLHEPLRFPRWERGGERFVSSGTFTPRRVWPRRALVSHDACGPRKLVRSFHGKALVPRDACSPYKTVRAFFVVRLLFSKNTFNNIPTSAKCGNPK